MNKRMIRDGQVIDQLACQYGHAYRTCIPSTGKWRYYVQSHAQTHDIIGLTSMVNHVAEEFEVAAKFILIDQYSRSTNEGHAITRGFELSWSVEIPAQELGELADEAKRHKDGLDRSKARDLRKQLKELEATEEET